jgi:hypothetical protein
MARVKALCASCKKVTNHVVLAKHDTSGDNCDGDIQWWVTYEVIQCLGCDDISFREVSTCTEDFDPRTGNLEENISLYPDRTSGRNPMFGYEKFPTKTKRIYMETIKALNVGTPLLAAIGLRALIESICLAQETKSRTLAKGIDELADMGLLSKKQAEFLHNHRFMGNEAAHEMVAPKPEHLVAALDIAETLLKTIYVLPEMADKIKKKP